MPEIKKIELGEPKDIREIIKSLQDFKKYLRATNQLKEHGSGWEIKLW